MVDDRRTRPGLDKVSYRRTRLAWERIWLHETDIQSEWGTLNYTRSKTLGDLYVKHLPKEGLVLEAGCGLGTELLRLEMLGYPTVGIDYAAPALSKLREARSEQRLVVADIHQLPFAASAYTAYLSFGVLEHFEFGPLPALKEANRMLNHGGLLVLSVPYPNVIWRLTRLRRALLGKLAKLVNGYFETTYTNHQLITFAKQSGFEVHEVHPVGHSFTLWPMGWPFRAPGYYRTSELAERIARILRRLAPWRSCFATLLIATKVRNLALD